MRCQPRSFVLLLSILLLAAPVGCSAGAAADSPEAQLSFGASMARRGLWSEALFRFRQADRLDPDNAHILNNIAVALEATGRFEEALEYYQRALKLRPNDRDMRRNYARFIEFFQSYQPEQTEATAEDETPPEGGFEGGSDDGR